MKNIKKLTLCFLSFTLLIGCKEAIQDFGDLDFLTSDDAIVKINMASVYSDDRYMYVRFNDQRVTPRIRAREPYPGGGYNTRGDSRPDFLKVSAGTVNIKVCLPHSVDIGKDSIVLSEQSVVLEGGKQYTLHVTDTAANTQLILSQESLARPDSSFATYRFVNLMPNVEAIDLYYGFYSTSAGGQSPAQDSLVASGIKYGQISDYFTLNRVATRTWKIRPAGAAVTNETVLAFYTSTSSTLDRRSYTAYALGYAGFTSTIMKPYISFYLVR